MTSVNDTEERRLAPKNIILAVRNKHNHVVTSTPIKNQTLELLKMMDQWPSPVRPTPTATQSRSPIILYTLAKGNQENNQRNLDDLDGAATRSIDKIYLVNHSARGNEVEKNPLADDGDNAEKIVVKKRWMIVDSDEEEILKNESKTEKKKKNLAPLNATENRAKRNKPRKASVAKSSTPNMEEEQNDESNNVAEMKPQISRELRVCIPRLKSKGSKIAESIQRRESSDDSDSSIIFTPSKTPTATQSRSPIILYTLAKGNQENNQRNLDDLDGVATRSIDEIYLVNDSARENDGEKNPSPEDGDNAEKIVVKKRWMIVDSDEEEIWQNQSKTEKKKKNLAPLNAIENRAKRNKPRKASVAKSSTPNMEEEQNDESDNVAEMKPQISRELRVYIPRLKSKGLKIAESIQRRESSDDSDSSIIFTPSKKRVKTTRRKDNENTSVRKSTRKKCEPLEFWKGERMNTVRDLSSKLGEVKARKNSRKKGKKEIRDAESESERIESVPNVPRFSPETKANPTAEKDDKKAEKKKTRSNLTRDKNSEAKVKFSSAETETTTDNRPADDENLMPAGQTNFVDLQTLAREPLPTNKSFITLPQLKNFMGIVSSAIVVIKTKSFLKSRASDQRHLIFCVMSGTVKVLITIEGAEMNKEMKPCGHFVVPRRASYSIENVKKEKAILSRFEISCGTEYEK